MSKWGNGKRRLHAWAWVLLCALAGAALTASGAQAATIQPDSFADDLINNGNCTLREAVQAANTDTAIDGCNKGSGADSIKLKRGTYTLSIPGKSEDLNQTGDLDIRSRLRISGVTVDPRAGFGRRSTIDAAGVDRAIHVDGSMPDVKIVSIGVRNGATEAAELGGGIRISGDGSQFTFTAIRDSLIAFNQAEAGGGVAIAGPPGAFGGDLHLEGVRVEDNEAAGHGGGVYAGPGSQLRLEETNVARNTASSSVGGGLSMFRSGEVRPNLIFAKKTTFAANTSHGLGGAAYVNGSFDWEFNTVTVSGNQSNSTASDGVHTLGGEGEIQMSTFADNAAGAASSGLASDSPVELKGSIIDEPCAIAGAFTSKGHNMIRDLGTCSLATKPSDAEDNARLRPLRYNGGVAFTHGLPANSPAIGFGPKVDSLDNFADGRAVFRNGKRGDAGAYERVSCLGNLINRVTLWRTTALPGSSGNDGFFLSRDFEKATGGGGNDTFCVVRGREGGTALGGTGNDKFKGGDKNDRFKGGSGRDTAKGGEGRDRLDGGGGSGDKLFGGRGPDILSGGGGKKDVCDGGTGRDRAGAGCERRRNIP